MILEHLWNEIHELIDTYKYDQAMAKLVESENQYTNESERIIIEVLRSKINRLWKWDLNPSITAEMIEKLKDFGDKELLAAAIIERIHPYPEISSYISKMKQEFNLN